LTVFKWDGMLTVVVKGIVETGDLEHLVVSMFCIVVYLSQRRMSKKEKRSEASGAGDNFMDGAWVSESGRSRCGGIKRRARVSWGMLWRMC
jgi:hypothetical protein